MVVRVSLSFPHEQPEIALSTLLRSLTFLAVISACFENTNVGSNITPSILGFVAIGMQDFPRCKPMSMPTSFVHVVKIVAVDLLGESLRFLLSKKSAIRGRFD